MKFELLNKVLFLENNIIKISPSFVLGDINQVIMLISELEKLFINLSTLSEKGFINDPSINLPVVLNIVQHFGLFKHKKLKVDKQVKFNASIGLNTLYYNLVLLVIYRIIIMIDK